MSVHPRYAAPEEAPVAAGARGKRWAARLEAAAPHCLAEAISTFALVFAGTGAIVIDDVSPVSIGQVGVGLTFGLVVMAMIYAVGDVSGAHLNPAVTVGFYVAGRLGGRAVGPYVASQLAGALLASGLLRTLFPGHTTLGATLPAASVAQSFFLEVVLTALLMFVILCVAHGSKEKGLVAGMAIGGTVGLEAIFAGPISGASMNPARSLAPAVVSGHLSAVWLYPTATVLGATAAVPAWFVVHQPSSSGVPERHPDA